MSTDLLLQLEVHADSFLELAQEAAGRYLHHLDVNKHSEDEVRAAIDAFPDALSHPYFDDGDMPIRSAALTPASIPFVPLLAEKGVSLNVGGEGQRGGLLVEDSDGDNVLQLLAGSEEAEAECFDAIKKLRALELIWKEDIRQYNLLGWSCHPVWGKTRFDYFVDWDPEALKHYNDDGDNSEFIHTTVNRIGRSVCCPLWAGGV